MTTTTELQLTFKSSAGKKKSLNLPYAVKGLSADVVREPRPPSPARACSSRKGRSSMLSRWLQTILNVLLRVCLTIVIIRQIWPL